MTRMALLAVINAAALSLSCTLPRHLPGHGRHGVTRLSVRVPAPVACDSPASSTPSSSLLLSLDFSDWDERETWALEDHVRRFCVDGGRFVLWRRLSLEVPELLSRSPKELRARWLALKTAREQIPAMTWEDVPCLEQWQCVAPGRYQGELHGAPGLQDGSLSVTIQHDAEAVAANEMVDLFGEQWCVRTRTGDLFQLGERALLADATEAGEASAIAGLKTVQLGDTVSASMAGLAGAASFIAPPLLMGGALLAASTAGYLLLGHHHVDVSVFIV